MYPYDWQRSVLVASYLTISVVIVGALYWAQAVFVPLALAVLLTLILAPVVTALQRLRVRRSVAVILVVALTTGLVAGIGWVVARQFVELAEGLPAYSHTIKTKVRSLRVMASSSATDKVGKLIEEISNELRKPTAAPPDVAGDSAEDESGDAGASESASGKESAGMQTGAEDAAPIVMMQPESPLWLDQLMAAVGSLASALGTFALAVVLTIFMLLNRESLRDRLIRLMGHGRLTATTKALDEAVRRISRFLLMQVFVNGTYGIALAIGLLLVGVEYALLWGFLAAVLRYIPYLGAWIAAAPPVLLSFAISDGWLQPLMVVGWIVVIELVSNNIVEPQLYGHSMGVSEVALLVAAAFWAFLWGPIGLVLSSPLTVCLVVLGKYVPKLEFIDILLGDKPALQPHQSFYQRLLAGDRDEAWQIALKQMEAMPPNRVFDALIIPALSYFKNDLEQEQLTGGDERCVLSGLREIVDALGERIDRLSAHAKEQAALAESPEPVRRVRILSCPADGEVDEVAIDMLGHLLEPWRWDVQVAGDDVLAAELLESVASENVPIVCIGSLSPGGLAHARYFCKRLRSCRSDVKIVVGRWGSQGQTDSGNEQFRAAGADNVEWTLLDTSNHLDSWWRVLVARGLQPGYPG